MFNESNDVMISTAIQLLEAIAMEADVKRVYITNTDGNEFSGEKEFTVHVKYEGKKEAPVDVEAQDISKHSKPINTEATISTSDLRKIIRDE